MLEYKINVIETLNEAGYNSTRILKENILSQSAMQKLRKGEMVGIKTLEQLCELLDMQPGNIIKYTEDKPKRVYNIIVKRESQMTIVGQAERGGNMNENMTDKQLEVILNLVADKFESCKNMEEVKKAIEDVRNMAKKEKAE